MQQRSLGRKNDLFGEPALQITHGKLRGRTGRTVMVTRFGIQIRGRIAVIRIHFMTAVDISMVMGSSNCVGQVLAAMGGDRSRVKAGKDQGHKAKKGDQFAHGGAR